MNMSNIPKELREKLEADQIESLSLSSKGLNDADALELASLIKSNKNLKVVNLSYNNFSSDGIICLAKAFTDTQITHLHLNKNNITDESAVVLLQCLQNVSSLNYLGLWSNNLTDGISKDIADFLQTHQSLEEIDLYNNYLTEQSICSIFTALKDNVSLKKINIYNEKAPVSEATVNLVMDVMSHKNYDLKVLLRAKSAATFETKLLETLQKERQQALQKEAKLKQLEQDNQLLNAEINMLKEKSSSEESIKLPVNHVTNQGQHTRFFSKSNKEIPHDIVMNVLDGNSFPQALKK